MSSDNIDIRHLFNKIDFVTRYQTICEKHNDFEESSNGNSPEVYARIITDLGYEAKYHRSESFYKIVEQIEKFEVVMQLVLKNGLVEVSFFALKDGNYCIPDGRLDFLALKLDANFDRKKYNLPKYKDESELQLILKNIFGIYEDFKHTLCKL